MTPYYIIDESRLRANLQLIRSVSDRAGVDIILAFKAFAQWKTFPIFREYIASTTASSLAEARLASEEFGSPAHTFSPAYTDDEFDELVRCSSHLSFNSLSQYQRFHTRVGERCSIGLRVNPEYSEVGTLLYNPCAPGTRFGILADNLPADLPADVEGFHCHCHCESGADVFERTLRHIEAKFSRWFGQLRWINFGGGHLMTRADYDVERLITVLTAFKARYPHLRVILEPGSAFAWQTGELVAEVVDIVENHSISTAILNVSFTCHMPDCLEMPYYPVVTGAEHVDTPYGDNVYRLGGNSCLSGDFMEAWRFDQPLHVGDVIVFEDMIHYTTVKTTMFNGITHPDIRLRKTDGTVVVLRHFGYEDYKNRVD